MSIRILIDASNQHIRQRRRAVEGALRIGRPMLYYRYRSLCESSKESRRVQFFSILLCTLSCGYIAIALEDNLLFAYVVVVSACFLVNGCRACLSIHRRIDRVLMHFNQKNEKHFV